MLGVMAQWDNQKASKPEVPRSTPGSSIEL